MGETLVGLPSSVESVTVGASVEAVDRLAEVFEEDGIPLERLNETTVAVRGAKNEKAARDLGEKLRQHGLYVE